MSHQLFFKLLFFNCCFEFHHMSISYFISSILIWQIVTFGQHLISILSDVGEYPYIKYFHIFILPNIPLFFLIFSFSIFLLLSSLGSGIMDGFYIIDEV